ncbi:MAG TPA: tyrosine-type recombinase/integrase [Dictyobacter sp.]|nr:tyrosine-type recombinase/integrase [Dictyobacter sp.]
MSGPFHDLCHSTATFLLSMGVDTKVIQEILGHSAISITADIYSHVSLAMQKNAMNKLENLFDSGDIEEEDD